MTAPIAVCIPSIGRSELLRPLVDVVLEEVDVDPEAVEIWDNHETAAPHPDVPVIRASGLSIYQEWNEFADCYGDTHHLAFLNDDIEMLPGTLELLAEACDDGWACVSVSAKQDAASIGLRLIRRAKGTYRQFGLCGWAFMVAKGHWPDGGVDERYRLWYGDDDLFWKINAEGGKTGVLEGVSVRHETSTTLNSIPHLDDILAADTRAWKETGRP